ncbi:unnamed protein product, partial [Ectocarpus sp. 12 AP-2014]
MLSPRDDHVCWFGTKIIVPQRHAGGHTAASTSSTEDLLEQGSEPVAAGTADLRSPRQRVADKRGLAADIRGTAIQTSVRTSVKQ